MSLVWFGNGWLSLVEFFFWGGVVWLVGRFSWVNSLSWVWFVWYGLFLVALIRPVSAWFYRECNAVKLLKLNVSKSSVYWVETDFQVNNWICFILLSVLALFPGRVQTGRRFASGWPLGSPSVTILGYYAKLWRSSRGRRADQFLIRFLLNLHKPLIHEMLNWIYNLTLNLLFFCAAFTFQLYC